MPSFSNLQLIFNSMEAVPYKHNRYQFIANTHTLINYSHRQVKLTTLIILLQ